MVFQYRKQTAHSGATLPHCCCKEQGAAAAVHAFNLNFGEAEQVDLSEIKANLIYIANFRPSRGTCMETLSLRGKRQKWRTAQPQG